MVGWIVLRAARTRALLQVVQIIMAVIFWTIGAEIGGWRRGGRGKVDGCCDVRSYRDVPFGDDGCLPTEAEFLSGRLSGLPYRGAHRGDHGDLQRVGGC